MVGDTRVLPCKVFEDSLDLVYVVVQPSRDHAVAISTEQAPDFSSVVVVVHTKVVSVFSRSKKSWITLTNIAASSLLANQAFILMLFDSILLFQSLVVRRS